MAIAYSYSQETQLSLEDMLVGTSITEVEGRKKLITKNFTLEALGQFMSANFPDVGITLTTTGTSGVATLVGDILNIPNYSAFSNPTLQSVTDAGSTTTNYIEVQSPTTLSVMYNNQIGTFDFNLGSGIVIDSTAIISFNNGTGDGILSFQNVLNSDVTFNLPNKPPTAAYTIATLDDLSAQGLPTGGTAGQILTKVDSTDYNATWQENFADWTSQVKHIVKNNGLSGTITKGTAVYVTGSNGTNMLVGRASNASEPTSSKTMGLMQSDITTTGGNQTGFVITEGLLEGLNTAAATAGDPVWLGVNGALIYGLINKPYAPAHLVFIGIVTKVSAGNGEIWVKVQNGFELKEIHDVDLITTNPINGHLLGFNGTLWVNKTIATWLGFTPENVANKSTSTSLGTSDTLYPTQNAVKSYADSKVTDEIVNGVTTIAPSQNAVFDALATRSSKVVNIITPSPSHTGTTTETQITSFNFTIPANTYSAADILKVETISWQKTGVLNASSCRLKLSNTNTYATASNVLILSASGGNINMRGTRTYKIESGNLKGFMSAAANGIFNDNTLTNIAISTLALDFTQPIYGFISLQLTNAADSLVMNELIISK